jgi:REP element-mobilizing transposase RayT
MLGVHWVWSTYGTWLPGDARGHWSPLFDLYGRIVDRGGKLNMPDEVSVRRALTLCKEPPKVLDQAEQRIVARAIGKLIRPLGDVDAEDGRPVAWAAAVEATHVHLLTSVPRETFASFVGRLKGTSSSAVLAEFPGRERTWASGYWKVYLDDMIGIEAVGEYIDAHNERKGLAAKPYEWISPVSPPLAAGVLLKTRRKRANG